MLKSINSDERPLSVTFWLVYDEEFLLENHKACTIWVRNGHFEHISFHSVLVLRFINAPARADRNEVCFKRTSPGELEQSPIKGEHDHKAYGPHGGAKSQLKFWAAPFLFALDVRERKRKRGREWDYCTFDLQSQLNTKISVPHTQIPSTNYWVSPPSASSCSEQMDVGETLSMTNLVLHKLSIDVLPNIVIYNDIQ